MNDKDKVKILSLVNGNQFLAKIEQNETSHVYKIEKPVELVIVGEGQIGMRPAIIGMDFYEPIYIEATRLATKPVKPEESIVEGYLQKYHNKPAIQVATAEDVATLRDAEKRIGR